jgi:hypothetical protein
LIKLHKCRADFERRYGHHQQPGYRERNEPQWLPQQQRYDEVNDLIVGRDYEVADNDAHKKCHWRKSHCAGESHERIYPAPVTMLSR